MVVRHQKKGKKLGRDTKSRKALFKNLLTCFFLEEAIITTEAKAKAIKGKIDRLISKAKNPNLVNRRLIYAYLTKPAAAKKLIDDIAPRYTKRTSGYSRIIKLGTRIGDRAEKVKIELVSPLEQSKPEEKKKKKKKPAKKKTSTRKKKTTSSKTTKKAKK